MALLVPGGGCARLAISHPAQVSRRTAVVATLSPPKRDKVDYWVDATSSFFEPDSRPIMLYDGNYYFLKNYFYSVYEWSWFILLILASYKIKNFAYAP